MPHVDKHPPNPLGRPSASKLMAQFLKQKYMREHRRLLKVGGITSDRLERLEARLLRYGVDAADL